MTARGTYTVVVVDDNPDDRAEVRRLLLRGSERRYRFVEAATGAAAVREVRALLAGNGRRPDGVVLDYALPDASALEVIAQLIDGAGVPPCPIVVLTGSVGSSEGASVLRAGAQDFLSKSGISAESLTRALENAMERYEMARELRERETALRYSEERFRLAAEAANALVYDVDLRPGGGVVAHGTERLVGAGGREPLAVTREWWRARIDPADRAGGLGSEASSLEVGDIYRAVYRVRHELGYWVDVEDTGQVVRDLGGAPERLVGAVVDVTARKRAEAALRAADRQKDEFLAVLAHELRNPLAPIRTAVDLLRSGRVPADRLDHLLGVVDRQSAQLVRLVDDLMDVSRIRSGKVVLRRERVALGDAAVTAVESVQPLMSERRHRLSVTLPDEPLFVDGDLARITQILTNLLTNAAKYMDAGGQIWLDLRREERWAVARIRDTGMGIGSDVLPHVFKLFVQADQTRHRAQGGLGLGLGVVKRLVELHGGTGEAGSGGPGRGRVLTVRQPPRGAPQGSPVARAPEGMAPLDGPLILVPDGDRNGADTAAETPARHEPRDRLATPRPVAPSSADERLVTVSVLMRLIASNADLGKTCDAVAEAAVRLLGARVARVWLNDPSQRILTACGTFGVDPNATVTLLEATQISHDSGMPGEAMRTRAPLYLADAAGDHRWVNRRFVREIGVRGYAGLPLVTGDQIWGILSVMFTTVRDFSAEDQALLELLADQSAIAIQSAQSRG